MVLYSSCPGHKWWNTQRHILESICRFLYPAGGYFTRGSKNKFSTVDSSWGNGSPISSDCSVSYISITGNWHTSSFYPLCSRFFPRINWFKAEMDSTPGTALRDRIIILHTAVFINQRLIRSNLIQEYNSHAGYKLHL